MKPIVSYYGGKQKMSRHLLPLIPPHKVYVEPFAGGAALLFAKDPSEKEVINDLNGDLVNLYRVAQSRKAELIELLRLTPFSEAEYDKAKKITKHGHEDDLWRAWAIYVNIMQSFAHKVSGGWSRCAQPTRVDPAEFANAVDRLPEQLDRLRHVYICSTDAIKCIEQWDSEDAFFYCDPPYPGTHQGHYAGCTVEDFQRLVDCLAAVKGSFMLSCYPVDVNTPPIGRCISFRPFARLTPMLVASQRSVLRWFIDI